MKRILPGVFLALAFILGLGGCSTARDSAAGDKNHRPRKLGATYMIMNNPYFEAISEMN